ncbi:MAG: MBL fold metallo-hydrolase [Patescibacteria group bacterium]
MNIQYYGHSCFKLITKPAGRGQDDVTVFFDPFDKAVGLRPPQGSADVVLVSHNHHDHNNAEALKGEPRILDIPGEYSISGVNIVGIDSFHDENNGETHGKNTIFLLESEELKICHLGDLGCELTSKQLDQIDGVDILMIPIGGKYTLDAEKAVDIIKKIEPAIIIPIHYKMPGSSITDIDDEKKFCNEIGNCPAQKVSKLNIKKKDLEGKSMEVVLMGIE